MNFIIADDHPLVRQGVRMMLELEYPGSAFRETASFAGTADAAAAWPEAMLLVDLDMPGMTGVDSLRALHAQFPGLRIAVHTGSVDRQTVLDALAAGVNGYIVKASPVEELLFAISTILAGRVYITEQFSRIARPPPAPPPPARPPPAATAAPVAQPEPPQPAAHDPIGLTRRETEVLRCLLLGQSNKHIARHLGIGEGTVKVHLASIFKALGARNRTEAALIAAERGIMPNAG